MSAQVAFNVAIGAVTALGVFFGPWLAWKGRQGELRQLAAADAIKASIEERKQAQIELQSSLAEARRDLDYWKGEAETARNAAKLERAGCADELKQQQARCERNADRAEATIVRLVAAIRDEATKNAAAADLQQQQDHLDTHEP